VAGTQKARKAVRAAQAKFEREQAAAHKARSKAISEALTEHGSGLVRAVIAGRADGETDNLGVFLHLRLGREIVPDHPD
jgi:hypothetical protein